mgnify:CR=1 FL=1
MKYVSEYRNPTLVKACAEAIANTVSQPWTIMEICGGQTHTIVKYGLTQLLPPEATLIHGPGCPVCVTPMHLIDRAIALAELPHVILCSFGDMLRVPGSKQDLFWIKAQGGDVRVVYSPLDALAIAHDNPQREVVFFAIGFETTAPATAMAVYQAHQQNLNNFSLLVSHVLVPPAMEAILSAPNCQVQGFLAAGHVCTVMGYHQYSAIASRYQVPIVVTGFEPVDIMQGIYRCIQQLETGQFTVDNQYQRSVSHPGNQRAQQFIQEIFEIVPRDWRGIGSIPNSGFQLRDTYARFDAQRKFQGQINLTPATSETECISGEIMQGQKKPPDCPAFGVRCTPESPIGAPMVSSEGACVAYYRYQYQRSHREP